MPNRKWTVNLSPRANKDLIDIWDYLACEASERVADRQLRQIEAGLEMLKSWPYSGRKRDELRAGMRSVPVHPYVILYRVHAGAVEIYRILHGCRDIASIFASSLTSKKRST
jgi:toxin ParE1/3/4